MAVSLEPKRLGLGDYLSGQENSSNNCREILRAQTGGRRCEQLMRFF